MSTATRPLDPVTLEILSNRLWITNDEAAATVRRVSGSPVANEICDFNTALLRANGDAFMVGMYMTPLSMGHDLIVKSILADYSENPGIEPDDMFICSDPYRGCTHQNDVTVVAPVHVTERLVAWTGVTIHQVDVGGPVYGSQASVGATSIYQEALPMAPMKIVERGRLRRDVEEEYLIRSRTRDLNQLDLRAKIAANNLAKERILESVERYGENIVVTAIDSIVDRSEERLRRRLESLPDGTWRHRAYMDDSPGVTHYFELAVTKAGSELLFDFTGTGPQAGAIYNCSKGGLMGGILSSLLPILFYGMYWCPAAARRVVNVRTEPGTLVDAVWPAGMCKATTAAIAMVNTIANVCLGKMMAAAVDPESASRAMAPWMAAATVQELSGTDQRGRPFGATMLDPMAGGAGAKAEADGIDSGGVVRAAKLRIANVETYEFRYPILYLHRRQEPDSEGAGTFRGGVGCSLMFTPHGTDEIPVNVMHTINCQAPATVGILGGFPAGTNSMVVLRDSSLWAEIGRGALPTELDQLQGRLEIVPVMASSNLMRGDVYRSLTCGGGGFGDPLFRDPARVVADVAGHLVSREQAELKYGVVLDGAACLDEARTREQRRRILAHRLQSASPPTLDVPERAGREVVPAGSLGGSLRMYSVDEQLFTGCKCGRLLAPIARNYKEGLARLEGPIQEAGVAVNPYRIGGPFVFRRFVCPDCGRLLETEVARPDDPILKDIDVSRSRGTELTTEEEYTWHTSRR